MKLGRFISITEIEQTIQQYIDTFDWSTVIDAYINAHNADPTAHPALAVTDLLYLDRVDEVQSIPNAIATPVSFDTETYDVEGFWDAGAPTNIVIPADKTGLYLVSFYTRFATNTTGYRESYVYGCDESIRDISHPPTGISRNTIAAGLMYIYEATTLQLRVRQNSGGSLDLEFAQLRLARLKAI